MKKNINKPAKLEDIAISVKNVSKTFKLPHEKQSSVKGVFINMFRGKKTYEKQQALKDITFDVKKGEFFGIVGRNGSGKSTLLKIISQIYIPDKGNIVVNGKLTPFIELGVGFNPELSGKDNVYLNGALLGFSREEVDSMYEEIVVFAELERFMDQKLKNYSSGMQVRLAFSIAIRAETDILVLDEVLAVGDSNFQKKCYDYFKQLKREKKTVVFVSHDTSALLEYCEKGVLIDNGTIICEGNMSLIVNNYIDTLNKVEDTQSKNPKNTTPKQRWGTKEVMIESIIIENSKKGLKAIFDENDEIISIKVIFKAKNQIKSPVLGLTITDMSGQRIITSNTLWQRIPTKDLNPGDEIIAIWRIPNIFNTGTFRISPAVADENGLVVYDWREEMTSFKVRKDKKSLSLVNVSHRIEIK